MLHNTGSYGPNEAPINMGASVNVSQLNSPMSMVQNLSNLDKTSQNPPQTAAGHFGLPIYPSYTSSSPNMGPQMHTFPHYHHSLGGLGYQTNYMSQGSPGVMNLGWQNGMLPMNLNTHNESAQNVSNHTQITRRVPEHENIFKEPSFSPKVPLNVPQVPNNYFSRQFPSANNSQTTVSEHFKPFEDLNSEVNAQEPEKLINDNNRRKNLENTVRLIENILINTTKNREMQIQKEASRTSVENIENAANSESIEPISSTTFVPTESITKKLPEIFQDPPKPTNDPISLSETTNSNYSSQNNDENDQTTQQHPNIKIKLEPEEISEVEVKIEPISSWTDTEHTAPFHRDVNGAIQDDVGFGNVVDSESSVAEANRVVQYNLDSDCFFECPYCNLLFKHPKRFLIHTKWHMFGLINEKRIEQAKEKESKRRQLKESRLTDKGITVERKTWACKDCDKIFHARGGLESHRKRYHTNIIRECKMCSKTITGWSAWKAHLATHNTESGYQCPYCPKRFKYTHSLSKHRDTHLEKTHECSECPKKFGSQTLLRVHMKSHERVQKGASFHCSFCAKAFFDKFNLQIHERTHTNERPFVCEICNASFGCNSNLSRHMKVSHSASKPYECRTCHRSFAAEGIRDRHELRVHGDPEDFKYVCKQCPSRYMKLNELKKHTYKMHPKSKSKQQGTPEEDK